MKICSHCGAQIDEEATVCSVCNMAVSSDENLSAIKSIGTFEAANKWKVKQSTVQKWCRLGKIPGAKQDKPGSPWHIPENAENPMKGNKK